MVQLRQEKRVMVRWVFARWCFLFILAACSVTASAEADSRVGQTVAEFELKDVQGISHRLSDFEDSEFVALVFLGTECPLAKLYAPRLKKLANDFKAKGVQFVGINSNRQDSLVDLGSYVRLHEFDFPFLKDIGNALADQLDALRTPEVFLLDENRVVRYWGRIDDQYGVGFVRDVATREDLRIALEELISGQPVSQPELDSVGCYIGRITEPQANAFVTYSNQIARILQRRCVECHHDGEFAPFALDDYEEVVGWADTIKEVVEDERMPPWHADPAHGSFKNDRRLSQEERQMIFDWVAAGAPEGDPGMLPPMQTFKKGWGLPTEPDIVVNMRDEPFEVPAEGVVRYQYFEVDPGFTEDTWVKALEIVPGNFAVVHHALVFEVPQDNLPRGFGGGINGFLAAYVPGLRSKPFPKGMAKRISAGSKLLFQIHYTPVGTVQKDNTKVGFVTADPAEVTHEVKTRSAYQRMLLEIPPHDGDFEQRARTRVRQNAQMLSMMPHMHLRGRAFRYELRLPGSEEWQTLLNVPNYDFNWQTQYQLMQPLELPADAIVRCIASFDNSAENPANPKPDEKVEWGNQSWEEMLIGYFDVAIPRESIPEDAERDGLMGRAEDFLLQFDINDDGSTKLTELPWTIRPLSLPHDKNKDGVLSPQEFVTAVESMMRNR